MLSCPAQADDLDMEPDEDHDEGSPHSIQGAKPCEAERQPPALSRGELLRLRTTVASLDAAAGFVATLAGAGSVLDSLLASSVLSDVQV